MPVLVTGASGFIGRQLCARLLETGQQVRALLRPGGGAAPAGTEPVAGALEAEAVARAAEGCSQVFHLAGLTRAANEAAFWQANSLGSFAVARGCALAGAKLIYVSSLAAAGPAPLEQPRTEADPCQPITAYGRSKLMGEYHVWREPNLCFTIVRPGGVYGPHDQDFLFAFQAAKWGFFPVLGNPERGYSLIHVDDLVKVIIGQANLAAAEGQAVFAVHPVPVRWGEILATLATVMNKPYHPIAIPDLLLGAAAWAGEAGQVFGQVGLINQNRVRDLRASGWVASSDKLLGLGLQPQIDLQQGFSETAAWYRGKGLI
jgi:dihydroflavonol-4-reductase